MAFYAYEVAIQICELVPPIVAVVKKRSADLADQIERASSSVVLNLAEGNRRTGADRLRFFRNAEGSAAEIQAALRVARAWGCAIEIGEFDRVLGRELGLLFGLTHSKKLGARV